MYGSCGRPEHLAPVPSSTSCRGAARRCGAASRSTTARSWLMNSVAKPNSLLQLGEQLEHARLHRDVERARRLVGDEQLRVERERAREARALALAAGELVRVAVAEGVGQLHRLEQLVDRCRERRGHRSPGRGRSAARRRTAAIVSSGLKLVAGSWKTKPDAACACGRNSRSLHAEHLGAEHPAASRR